MRKKNSKRTKKIQKLFVALALSVIILGSSTYAWFIGMTKVHVTAFEVNIKTTESLALSLDGATWAEELTIDSTSVIDDAYAANTNSWGGVEGLIPVSTVGEIDETSSRLVMFEKGSLTATAGGYRLMASQMPNDGAAEAEGYVAFDLFVRNLSGAEYYTDLNFLNEEAIYLNLESSATVGATGGVANTGIENSVRVAFAQLGRVRADAAVADVTGITCATTGAVTGICADREAQIWEPNDSVHHVNAINWVNTSCRQRTAEPVAEDTSYNTALNCAPIVNGTFYPTYSIASVIDYTDNIDVYDGYNNYTLSANTMEEYLAAVAAGTEESIDIVPVDTFTDTEKNQANYATATNPEDVIERPEFMRLAPNSITKIRVYVYIEGQDIDNYDFASLGNAISVNFGFTKQKYFEDDVDYDDTNSPSLPSDVVRP